MPGTPLRRETAETPAGAGSGTAAITRARNRAGAGTVIGPAGFRKVRTPWLPVLATPDLAGARERSGAMGRTPIRAGRRVGLPLRAGAGMAGGTRNASRRTRV